MALTRVSTNVLDADLTDGGESSTHYHSSDRNRANHSGTQTLDTISDAGNAAALNTGSTSGSIPLIGAGDVLPTSVLPPLSVSDTYTAANETAQLALSVQKGDVCVRTDESKSYINTTGNNTAMSDWQELLNPGAPVTSVNGSTGVVTVDESLFETDGNGDLMPKV